MKQPSDPIDRSAEFEQAIAEAGKTAERYVLRLYITGSTAKSTQAIRSIRPRRGVDGNACPPNGVANNVCPHDDRTTSMFR